MYTLMLTWYAVNEYFHFTPDLANGLNAISNAINCVKNGERTASEMASGALEGSVMRTVVRVTVVLIAISIGALGVAMTFRYGLVFSNGSERYGYAALFACFDTIKLLLPSVAIYLSASRHRKASFGAQFFYAFFVILSLGAHVGLVLTVKEDDASVASVSHARFTDARVERDTIRARIDAIGSVRPMGQILADIQRSELDEKYTRSEQCNKATLPDSREFCATRAMYHGEERNAKELKELRSNIDAAQLKLDMATNRDAMKQANAVTATIASKIGLDEAAVLLLLAFLVAIGIEFGSSQLLGLATAMGVDAIPIVTIRPREGEPVQVQDRAIVVQSNAKNGVVIEHQAPPMMDARLVPVQDDGPEQSAQDRAPDLPQLCPKEWIKGNLTAKRGSHVPFEHAFSLYCTEAKARTMVAAKRNSFARAITLLEFERLRRGRETLIKNTDIAIAKPVLRAVQAGK